ncbi:hypothetical protein BDQ12DRAFT_685148 [Crucibulum laeve]|uniref:Uncharacterized protein n=1 Tax=Crucibulum laeve TaxID=68775 RepID=A0A5C3LXZ7_9AGAR|nr:hypothetical protein BDQ12DRAFT_685148 [Crucibulum laeve]
MQNYPLPSSYGASIITYIPSTRYDAKGRQLQYAETETQRRERLAFLQQRKIRKSQSPTWSPLDPLDIGFITNMITEAHLSAEVPATQIHGRFHLEDDYSSPPPLRSFKRGHRRQRSSLSSIPEED